MINRRDSKKPVGSEMWAHAAAQKGISLGSKQYSTAVCFVSGLYSSAFYVVDPIPQTSPVSVGPISVCILHLSYWSQYTSIIPALFSIPGTPGSFIHPSAAWGEDGGRPKTKHEVWSCIWPSVALFIQRVVTAEDEAPSPIPHRVSLI